MTDDQLLGAAEAYEAERERWFVRFNKAFTPGRHEIIRRGDGPISDDTLPIMASAVDRETADYEMCEMRGIAAMKAALAAD